MYFYLKMPVFLSAIFKNVAYSLLLYKIIGGRIQMKSLFHYSKKNYYENCTFNNPSIGTLFLKISVFILAFIFFHFHPELLYQFLQILFKL